jgi:EmrB/QacA subfamily drug resistance transporter
MQWVINAYTLLLGSLILTGGSAGDLYGRRKIFVLGIVVFAAASVWCSLAPDITQLVLARGVQGIGGALMVPSSLAIIGATFDSEEQGRAIGTWAGFSALTTALGPLLGGWLVDSFSWRLIFVINIPLAIGAIIVTMMSVRESRESDRNHGLDWKGVLLATLGLGGITYALIKVERLGWNSPVVLVTLLGGALLLVLFLRVESRARAPMMPLGLFRSRMFASTNLLTFLLYFPLSGALFFLPFNLIQVQGYTTTEAGGAFLPFPIIMGGLSRWAGGLIDRYGARLPLIVGPSVVALGYLAFAVPGIGGSYWTSVFPAVTLLGLGMTISVAPLTTAVLGAADRSHAGAASGINNAISRISGVLAISIFGIVTLAIFERSLDEGLSSLSIPADLRTSVVGEREKLAAIPIPPTLPPTQRREISQAIDESFVASFRIVMVIAAAMALASAAVAWIGMKGNREARGG